VDFGPNVDGYRKEVELDQSFERTGRIWREPATIGYSPKKRKLLATDFA